MIVLLTFVAVEASNARIVRTWTYQEMFDKADLVVVAEFIGILNDYVERRYAANALEAVGSGLPHGQ